jgi:hypothetical protein
MPKNNLNPKYSQICYKSCAFDGLILPAGPWASTGLAGSGGLCVLLVLLNPHGPCEPYATGNPLCLAGLLLATGIILNHL